MTPSPTATLNVTICRKALLVWTPGGRLRFWLAANCPVEPRPRESFFATLKKELVHHEHYRTHAEARQCLFESIEVFYNRQRNHSAQSDISPSQFAEAL